MFVNWRSSWTKLKGIELWCSSIEGWEGGNRWLRLSWHAKPSHEIRNNEPKERGVVFVAGAPPYKGSLEFCGTSISWVFFDRKCCIFSFEPNKNGFWVFDHAPISLSRSLSQVLRNLALRRCFVDAPLMARSIICWKCRKAKLHGFLLLFPNLAQKRGLWRLDFA